MDAVDLASGLRKACDSGDLAKYRELWKHSEPFRRGRMQTNYEEYERYEKELLANEVIKWVKFGFRHPNADWREEGIKAGRTFFPLAEARPRLVKLDYAGALTLITMADETGEGDGDLEPAEGGSSRRGGGGDSDAKQKQRQQLAAEIVCEMLDYEEFTDVLCVPSMLNFLCVVLNQCQEATELVTRAFVKMSGKNVHKYVPVLMQSSVGDILESFIQTIQYRRPTKSTLLEAWARDIQALANAAHTLGTMIKYDNPCQIQTRTVINVFDALGVAAPKDAAPDNVLLLAELARLFYWMCHKSDDLAEKLYETHGGAAQQDPDYVLKVMHKLWFRCIELHHMIREKRLDAFCCSDVDRSKRLRLESAEMQDKMKAAEILICYTNCLLWMCLPLPQVRWKLRDLGFREFHLAFALAGDEQRKVTLSTVRHLADAPKAQECGNLMKLFGEQLLDLLQAVVADQCSMPPNQTLLLLETLSLLAMQRSIQELLAEKNIYGLLTQFADSRREDSPDSIAKIDLLVLFTLAEVAMHPNHRLGWVWRDKALAVYPPRKEFEQRLEYYTKAERNEDLDGDESLRTIGALVLTVIQEAKFQQPVEEIRVTLESVFKWWEVNTTTKYAEHRAAAEDRYSSSPTAEETHFDGAAEGLPPLRDLLQQRLQQEPELTTLESMRFCFPHECVLALTLFSRLALEPRFKKMFRRHLEALLCCVCAGVWAEAREAAATIANLMWLPDLKEELLVCWLKFDGPKCIAVDAANVLLPVKIGNPQPVDIGQGMYKSTWGVDFVTGSCVKLHRDGLRTSKIPGLLTTASPMDTFETTSRSWYECLGTEFDPKNITITCWFQWPATPSTGKKVLVQMKPRQYANAASVVLECEEPSKNCIWTLAFGYGADKPVATTLPPLSPGWHSLAIRCSTSLDPSTAKAGAFQGTKIFIDGDGPPAGEFRQLWLENDFYAIGGFEGRMGDGEEEWDAFGPLADFRIYARALSNEEIKKMALQKDTTESHPLEIVTKLSDLDAATVLAQRLDVPDCAAECLRALGSLATLSSQRAKIYSVCGRKVLQLLESPCPMIRRQAVRLLNNLA